MPAPALWLTTLSAFAAVMVLLMVLSGAIYLLTIVFPAPKPVARNAEQDDTNGFTAAIHAAVARAIPGAQVIDVREKGTPL